MAIQYGSLTDRSVIVEFVSREKLGSWTLVLTLSVGLAQKEGIVILPEDDFVYGPL